MSGSDLVAPALAEAVSSRTPEGGVDDRVVVRIVGSLPEIDLTGGEAAGLTTFVADSLQTDATLTRVGGEGAKGLSGASVYVIHDATGHPLGIAKTFPDSGEFVRELSALHRLHDEALARWFDAPQVLAAGAARGADGVRPVLVATFARGEAIDDLLRAAGGAQGASRVENLARLTRAVADAATAVARLHTEPPGRGAAAVPGFLRRYTAAIDDILTRMERRPDLFEAIGQLRLAELRARVVHVVGASAEEMHQAAILHGDFHPGNVYWDGIGAVADVRPPVTLIDTPTLHFSLDEHGRPIGTPERDVANFLERLSHYGRQAGLRFDEVAALRETFLTAYQGAGGAELGPATMRLFRARAVLGKVFDLGRRVDEANAGATDDPELTERIAELRAEIELLRHALGWGEER